MLSDSEERRLAEIESGLQADDPGFVQRFTDGPDNVRRWPGTGWACLAAVASVTVVVAGAVGSIALALLAVTATIASLALWVTHHG